MGGNCPLSFQLGTPLVTGRGSRVPVENTSNVLNKQPNFGLHVYVGCIERVALRNVGGV